MSAVTEKLRGIWSNIKSAVHNAKSSMISRFQVLRARTWSASYRIRNFGTSFWRRRWSLIIVFLVIAGVLATTLSISKIDRTIEAHFVDQKPIDLVNTFLMTLGAALFGASAIVSSFVLFAMQVNIQRMPHGLFRRFGRDPLLLLSFSLAFILSLAVLIIAVVPMSLAGKAGVALWATIVTILLFLISYNRALRLVNPSLQLAAVVKNSQQALSKWSRRLERARPLIPSTNSESDSSAGSEDREPDYQKVLFFNANSHWTNEATQGVVYSVSYARRFAEDGDYEVCQTAMNSILSIVKHYVVSKDGAFFSDPGIIEMPLSHDAFLSDTLDHLRQLGNFAIARDDEYLVEQVISLLAALVKLLASIQYPQIVHEKTHAHLAALHLRELVRQVAPSKKGDVLMHGLRQMREAASALMVAEEALGGTSLFSEIAVISAIGVATKDLEPVTSTGVEQLSTLSLEMLLLKDGNVRIAAEEIRGHLNNLTKFVLQTEDKSFTRRHRNLLGPYYSATSNGAFSRRLIRLVEQIRELPSDSETGAVVLANLSEWADQLYRGEREVFLLTIEKRSSFFFDHLRWIVNVSKVLIVAAHADCCDPHSKRSLIESALWLINIVSWVPNDKEAVEFVERHQIIESLFDASRAVRSIESPEIAAEIDKIIIDFGIKAGRFTSGRRTLEDALCALAVLQLDSNCPSANADTLENLERHLHEGDFDDYDDLSSIAAEIRKKASLLGSGARHSKISIAMDRSDHALLEPVLNALADLLDEFAKPIER